MKTGPIQLTRVMMLKRFVTQNFPAAIAAFIVEQLDLHMNMNGGHFALRYYMNFRRKEEPVMRKVIDGRVYDTDTAVFLDGLDRYHVVPELLFRIPVHE